MVEETVVSDWDKYIALREEELEEFQSFYENMTVAQAIETYGFPRSCRVSPDRKHIYVFDRNGHFQFCLEHAGTFHFEK